jgi:hypothetical protein
MGYEQLNKTDSLCVFLNFRYKINNGFPNIFLVK